MAGTPTYLAEGNLPFRDDTVRTLEIKLLGAVIDNNGGAWGTVPLSGPLTIEGQGITIEGIPISIEGI